MNTGGLLSKVIIGVVANLFIFTGCSRQKGFEGRSRTHAPVSSADTGILLEEASTESVQKILARHPQALVRVLNPAHGQYEIFGVDQSELAKDASLKVESNQYFTRKKTTQFTGFSTPVPAGVQVGALRECVDSSTLPTAIMRAVEPTSLVNRATVLLGQRIRMDGKASVPAQGHLSTAIVVMGPRGSKYQQVALNDNQIDFTPDALGAYQVILVAQDESDACAMDGVVFIVTANRKYNGPTAPRLNADLRSMNHLQMVKAEAGWKISEGLNVPIAVIDTGVNYNNPALAPGIELNKKEIADNGLDDDGNGIKDDVVGYDFVNNDEFPYDDDGHGSHVAGLAAGREFGLAREAKIIPIKALTSIGGDVGSVSAAIRYAVDRGAKIINLSLGAPMPAPHPALVGAIGYAEKKGVLLIVAAGNGDAAGLGMDIDDQPVYPAAMTNENLVSVTSCDQDNVLSPYANFGSKGVDVVAPGGSMPSDPMISAAYENTNGKMFESMMGTSMASPVVADIAAQVLSYQPHLSVKQLREILLSSGDEYAELRSVTTSGRRITSESALSLAASKSLSF